MKKSQDYLKRIFDRRIQENGYSSYREAKEHIAKYGVVVLLKEFSIGNYIKSLVCLHKKLSKTEKHHWSKAFTKIYFLLGNPIKAQLFYGDVFLSCNEQIGITKVLDEKQYKHFLLMFPKLSAPLKFLNLPVKSYVKYKIIISDTVSSAEEFLVDFSHTFNELVLARKSLNERNTQVKIDVLGKFVLKNSIYSRVTFDESSSNFNLKAVTYEQ